VRYVPSKEERELLDKVEQYAIYPPINGYPIRPDAPKEIFETLDRLREMHKKFKEENE